jgi:hypothetical protein
MQQLRRPIVIIVVLLVLALVLEVGFYLGQHAAFTGMGASPETYRAMQEELVALQDTLRSRDTELAILRTRQEVDRQALELVRRELASQKEEIAGLEEGLGFYRSLISPGEIAPGLSLRGIELTSGEMPRQYNYRIVVQQEARKHEQLKGTLEVVINGISQGQPVRYTLAELSEDFKGKGAALQFRYFQSIEGALILPEGFEPGVVSVEARTVKPHEFSIREDYPWQIEERFRHVGK